MMENLTENGILFGASVTVTTKNLEEVLSGEFVDSLVQKGCKLVIYIEYVPAEENTQHLAPGDAERARMDERLFQSLRESGLQAEKHDGGCVLFGKDVQVRNLMKESSAQPDDCQTEAAPEAVIPSEMPEQDR